MGSPLTCVRSYGSLQAAVTLFIGCMSLPLHTHTHTPRSVAPNTHLLPLQGEADSALDVMWRKKVTDGQAQ